MSPSGLWVVFYEKTYNLGAYKHCLSHLLDASLKKKHIIKGAKSCRSKKAHRQIPFTIKKIFNIEEKFNYQNDYKYAKSFEAKDFQRFRGIITTLYPGLWWFNGEFRTPEQPNSFLWCLCRSKWWGLRRCTHLRNKLLEICCIKYETFVWCNKSINFNGTAHTMNKKYTFHETHYRVAWRNVRNFRSCCRVFRQFKWKDCHKLCEIYFLNVHWAANM